MGIVIQTDNKLNFMYQILQIDGFYYVKLTFLFIAAKLCLTNFSRVKMKMSAQGGRMRCFPAKSRRGAAKPDARRPGSVLQPVLLKKHS